MLRILLIDDNPDDRLLVTRQLKQEFSPLEVTSIIDVKSFEEALATGNFNLVITDYRLLWSNGLVVLKAIKAQYPNCPVIMYTDSGNEEVAVLAMKSGLSDYVLKGRLQMLAIAVRESLAKQRLVQEYAVAVDQLQMSEQRLRLAMESAEMGTWDWDMMIDQVIWSENHERLFGVPLGSFLGTYEAFLDCVHPEDKENVAQAIERAWKTKTEYHDEFRVVWANGNVRWILSKGNFYYNKNGEPTRMIGVVLDITERKRREEELKQANRLKDEFLAIVSHELRTPLNAILGWTQLLRSRNFDEATRNQSLKIIERNALQQNQLINDILDTSRLIQGQMRLNVSAVNLVKVIENALDTVWLSAEAKGITLETILDRSITIVVGDENRLQQIFWNLFSNAIKFTPLGGRVLVRLERVKQDTENGTIGKWGETYTGHPYTPSTNNTLSQHTSVASSQEAHVQSAPEIAEIREGRRVVSVHSRNSRLRRLAKKPTEVNNHYVTDAVSKEIVGGVEARDISQINSTSEDSNITPSAFYAQITVSDNGEGISAEFLPYVFDRFRQADSTTTRSSNGLGLGLAIVRQLVELHGGTVAAASQGKGQGATFTVKLPLLEVNIPQPEISSEENCHDSQLNGLHILVVDDDTYTLELLVEILQSEGAKVTAVSSVGVALQILAQLKPDVLISDLGMPETDGYTLMYQVSKELGEAERIPAIALTAYSREEDKIQALEAGFQIFLSKPVNTEDLLSAISSLIA